ncbi:serine/threonine protein kinase [Arsukibacterium tuosuense]|uniref:Serine/threonine protein kinase n=2 Tax=Arsukibacterium tuosuense TaxID=1323745 RepID=A0A285JJ95_9GAMM|nr:serine/threonine protein kinase [Arsukibacterium tuosuense]
MWLRIEQIYYQATELPAAERNSFIKQQSSGDTELYRALQQLLASDGQTIQLQDMLSAEATSLLRSQQDLTGMTLGQYKLVHQLGRGGMGTVYLAERADKQFEKQVAVKVIGTTLFNPVLLHAFKTERQILADLEHAAISRLLDGGTTRDGMPYLVMEYVKGEPIDKYCAARLLSLTARLQLFVKVMAAVAFAHQKMVVHCDLKPSNILIDQHGEPKLLDFGIARLLNRATSTDATTATEQLGLTLNFASPEQKQGKALSALSDVYALGLVLQLLVAKSASSDVHWIIRRALQQEPANRYQSVTAFADDIKRFLGKHPIQARPGSWWYRCQTFVRRNTASSTLAAVILCGITAFSAAFWQQAQQVKQERDIARLQRDKALAITEFVTNMLGRADPVEAQGAEPKVRDVLDEASNQLAEQSDHALSQQPEVAAAVHRIIGRTYHSLGLLTAARQHLEQARQLALQYNFTETEVYWQILTNLSYIYQDQFKNDQVLELRYQALKLAEQLYGNDHKLTLGSIGNLAAAYMEAGELEKSEQMWLRLYQDRIRVLGEDHRDNINSLANLGVINHWLGRYQQAEHYYKRCFDMAERQLGRRHPTTLTCMSTLGSIYESSGQYQKAEPVITGHIELATEVLGELHPATLRSKHNLADSYRGLGRYAEADVLFRQVLAQRAEVLGSDNIETLQSQMKLARLLRLQQQFSEAEQLVLDAYNKQQKQLGEGHPSTLITAQVLADTYLAQQKTDAALQLYQQIVMLHGEKNADHPDIVDTWAGIARAYLLQGNPQQASAALERADRIIALHPQKKSSNVQQARLALQQQDTAN